MPSLTIFAQADPNAANGAGVFGGLLAMGILFWIIAIIATIFWLWMLVDVLASSKPTGEKLVWVIVMLVVPVLGSLIYLIVGRNSTSPRLGRV